MQNCPNCKAQNRDEARYCDNCGAPLTQDAAATTSPSTAAESTPAAGRKQSVNWPALLMIVAAIAVIAWLLLLPKGSGQSPSTTGGSTASSANPHGEVKAPGMEQMMTNLSDAKTKLEKDPLDIDSLTTLYKTYGMIGRQEKIRPYLDKALSELKAKQAAMGAEKAQTTASDLAYAALAGEDLPGALEAFKTLNKMAPDNLQVVSMIGDLNYDMGKADEAIAWYDKYLQKATAQSGGENYWKVRVDRALMLVQSGQDKKKPELGQQAITELGQVTTAQPKMFYAWLQTGKAYDKLGDKTKAKSALEQSVTLAKDAMEKWQAEAALAQLEGKQPPPMPTSPHGEGQGGMGGGDTSGMPNPHGGGGDGGMGGMTNPHGSTGDASGGMTNPHEGGGAASGG